MVSQFMHAPHTAHLNDVKCIFRYLMGTIYDGLVLLVLEHPGPLVSYSNADWTGYPDSRHSTTGYAVFLGPNLVSWRSKKQPTVSRSSTEAEYYVVADTIT